MMVLVVMSAGLEEVSETTLYGSQCRNWKVGQHAL
jgi:hypothetical protein